ncbi:MAG: hypothetical protein WAW59_06940 [Patescibacteria group bacterium]
MSPLGKRITLDEIATIESTFKSYDINTDERDETIHIYSEMGDNSVVYPILKLYSVFDDEKFEETGYKKVSATPYRITFEKISDGREYVLQWGGEWELTMDTFRDL